MLQCKTVACTNNYEVRHRSFPASSPNPRCVLEKGGNAVDPVARQTGTKMTQKWCLECGAAIIETEPCVATLTSEGRTLIIMGAQHLEGSQPAARVRCANNHTYMIAWQSRDGSGSIDDK